MEWKTETSKTENQLRFLLKPDGSKVLQQLHTITVYLATGTAAAARQEWHDVPMAFEP